MGTKRRGIFPHPCSRMRGMTRGESTICKGRRGGVRNQSSYSHHHRVQLKLQQRLHSKVGIDLECAPRCCLSGGCSCFLLWCVGGCQASSQTVLLSPVRSLNLSVSKWKQREKKRSSRPKERRKSTCTVLWYVFSRSKSGGARELSI